MLDFLSRNRSLLLGGGLALLVGTVLLGGRDAAEPGGGALGLVGAPVQGAVRGVASGVGSIAERYLFLLGARDEADRLRREVADLRRELMAVDEVAQENRRLRTLLHFEQATELPMVPARVIGRSASAWFRTIVLDKGSADGVRPNSPVVTAAGVVGRVYQLDASSSRVLLLTDTSSAVDAVVQRTRAPVIIEGRLGTTCRVLYLSRADEAAPGDRVVTSGFGDVFPKGLLLGQILKARPTRGGVFQAAELQPSVDFLRLEEVFVVLAGPAGAGEGR